MSKLKVGIPIGFDYNPMAGGGYSYVKQLIKGIDAHQFNDGIELVFLNFEGKNITTTHPLITFHPFQKSTLTDKIRKLTILFARKFSSALFRKMLSRLEDKHCYQRNLNIKKELIANGVHLLFYLNPDGNSYDFPFITTHWDIGHLSTYAFPEFMADINIRKNFHEHILPKALLIICETQTGKEELISYGKLNAERIEVMPMFPGAVIDQVVSTKEQDKILKELNLNSKTFFFYPAQFWAHKNHVLLIDAFEKVLKQFPDYKLVLTGSDKGNLSYIKNYITNKNLDESILILGFVSDGELYTLYKHTISLVMPSFLGPSNMPPLEAASLSCSVLLSNLKGHKELMGNYAKYFDPLNVESLTKEMLKVSALEVTEHYFENGEIFNLSNAVKSLENILLKAKVIRNNWR